MDRKICMALLCFILTHYCTAQQFTLANITDDDSAAVAQKVKSLANQVVKTYRDPNRETYLGNLFRLQMLTGRYGESLTTIKALKATPSAACYLPHKYLSYKLFAMAEVEEAQHPALFMRAYTSLFKKTFRHLDDKTAYQNYGAFLSSDGVPALKNEFQSKLSAARKKNTLSADEALTLCLSYYDFWFYQQIESASKVLIKEDCNCRYVIQNKLVSISAGVQISVTLVLKRSITDRQPAAMVYTIYADSAFELRRFAPAAYGYAGVFAYTRGKGLSPDKIVPYEDDGKDANLIITWVARQRWCNGKVGMYGGSYNGFTQWAAAKYHNPALKTIVPYVAAIPGLGLPMENNVFITANYGWAFYTTDNKYLDNKVYNDPKRWRSLNFKWFNSGAAYDKIDSVDGTPNPWLQRWLQHPDYDTYWQQQVPYKTDFANINIPVLTFEGYYDDGQISGMHYYLEHLKYNAKANHYLLIGPYDHFGTQTGGEPVLRGYKVDPMALISTKDITFEWMDYIMKGAKKPEIIQDKVNYEVMGANTWKHVPSVAKMADKRIKLYLTDLKSNDDYTLSPRKPFKKTALTETADLADRNTSYGDYYPFPIIKDSLDRSNGLFFISKPFEKAVTMSGMFSGELKAIINKKDMDITVVLYELTPEGKYFELSYFLGRASYAGDMSKRVLLRPGVEESIPFDRTRMFSRQLPKGSRLLVVLNIDKNPFAEINYGTGRDVATETMADGRVPLEIKWMNDSYIEVPVKY